MFGTLRRTGRYPPLCPAGHLPLKGGDRYAAKFRPSQPLRMKWWKSVLPISPLEGEMPGRAEGGNAPHASERFRFF
ncbi:lytic murein transglycosylase [Agrobacterium tumefaciens]|uniref:Lytic murein transglycosylase n=1 Tax=Agrobacterium tumefaciens TaxID=358 RepID=A0AAE6BPW3_AGRTU|nr:lytic murein transglycosylase [Agrobacterium tumefaciens]